MKFYDRKEEIALLERIVKQSREQSRMTVLVGRRRYW
jgi:AAA+ ATPase superfamily predicted ATPase